MPGKFWVESLHAATYLLNRLPTKALAAPCPYFALFFKPPDYTLLRTFGCLCYPNLSATMSHKLSHRSTACVFLGYPSNHRGYRCMDLENHRIIISRHVIFDETRFPFAPDFSVSNLQQPSSPPPADDPIDVLAPVPVPPMHAGPRRSAGPRPASSAPAPATPRTTVHAPASPAHAPAASAASSPVSPAHTPVSPASPASLAGHTPAHEASPTTASPSDARGDAASGSASPASRSATTTLRPSPPPPVRQMITRRQAGKIIGPRERLNLHVAPIVAPSPVPKSVRGALKDPNWLAAMTDEYGALLANNTWDLVRPPANANIVSGKWVFRHKFKPDGGLDRYKARWVLRGFSQEHGIDFDETFSPVVKPATIRVILSVALSSNWKIRQLDVKNAFLHGHLDEVVYCHQPTGFVDSARPDHVCRLNRALYGLKQAPRAWYHRFATFITTLGFACSKSDTSLFILHGTLGTAYLLLYVDDIILTASTSALLERVIAALSAEFAMTDLGELHHFLGLAVRRDSRGMFLSQTQYAPEILERAGMSSCHSASTPVDTSPKLAAAAGPPVADPSEYRSLAGALQYLTFTRPDIAYAVQQICLHMHDPRDQHLSLVKRVLRYIKGTLHHGLQLVPSSMDRLVAYTDANWAGCPDTRRSTSGYGVFFGDNLISWSSKRQHTVSRSSAEAEYRAVANAVAEASWLRQLLQELHRPLLSATVVFCDNVSAVYMSTNPVQHQRTKHIEIDLHFVRDRVALGHIRVLHVPSSRQFADIFIKGLPSPLFLDFRSSLSVRESPVATAGGC
ncbi:hypothetical protein ACQJBY_040029 [Aegilops geniculata]